MFNEYIILNMNKIYVSALKDKMHISLDSN